MKISCPRCGQSYDIDRTSIGKEADCTNCGNHFVIQATVSKPQKSVVGSVHCPYCAGEIVPGVKKCCHCGEWIENNKKGKILLFTSIGILLLILIASDVCFLMLRTQKNKQNETGQTASAPLLERTSKITETKPKLIAPTIGVEHFANPAHSATCILYKNDREFMRRDTTIGWVTFSRVECSPDDFFHVEMQYRNGYGVVKEITKSYSRKATQSSGNVIILEPEREIDREIQEWEKR